MNYLVILLVFYPLRSLHLTRKMKNKEAANIAEQRNKKSKENREVTVLVPKKKNQKELFDWGGPKKEEKKIKPKKTKTSY